VTDVGQIKKLLNDPAHAVDELVASAVVAHGGLLVAPEPRVVARAVPGSPGKVGVSLGGGSGHEPAFLGYVGPGLADSAAIGNVFAAPSPDVVLASIMAADHGAGVLLVYGNYNGDVMNTRLASKRAKASGVDVRSLFTTDDVASAPPTERDRRRGIAGEVFVFKIAGAAAESGMPIDEVERVANKANDRLGSMGVALSGAEIPGASRPIFESPAGQMEIGLGVHGEPGVRSAPLGPAAEVAQVLVETIIEDLGIVSGDRVAVLVNGLGATSLLEQYVVHGSVVELLGKLGVVVERSYVGEYVTSLQMAGVSVSLMCLDDELLGLLDAPARSVGWTS